LIGDYIIDYAHFGAAVTIEGDTIAVASAYLDQAVYVFVRSGTTWSRQTRISLPIESGSLYSGKYLSLCGDTLVVGLPLDDPSGVLSAGTARVWTRANGIWSEQAVLTADVLESEAYFGASTAIEDDQILVGAPHPNLAGTSDVVYSFRRSGTMWQQESVLGSNDPGTGGFGGDLAISGDTACVSADAGIYAMRRAAGAGTTFRNSGGNPASLAAVTPPALGTTYTATVDLGGTTAHNFAWLVGYADPLTHVLGGGQVVLVDTGATFGELLMQPVLSGPLATFFAAIPADPIWAGFELSTQALHIGGVIPFALSNALDLFVGN